MTKQIDTLVEDIYSTLMQGTEVSDDVAETFGKGLAVLIKEKLNPKKRDSKGKLWFSSIGKPDRQIWYQYHGYPQEKMQGHTLLKFLIGDLWESVLIFLSKVSGHTVEGEQEAAAIDGVTGRKDANIDGIPVDVKSASTYSFKKFKTGALKHDDPFGYLYQLSGYREAEKVPVDTAAFLAGDKQNGHLALLKLDEIELPNATKRITHVKKMVEGPIPERCYKPVPVGKSGNMGLAIGCQYCGYREECWKDVNNGQGIRTFLYGDKPVHLVEVKREPNVPELKPRETNESREDSGTTATATG